jgi:dTDP-glucose pyrophosphorylase
MMAGPNDVFKEAGYSYPKNLVEIQGIPLVELVLTRLRSLSESCQSIICTVRKDEDRKYHTAAVIRLVEPKAVVVTVNSTAGAACTALLAIEHLKKDKPLIIVNGDQVLNLDLAPIVAEFLAKKWDGGIVVFEAVHPRWSYVRCGDDGLVIETAEKRPISNLATAGVYFFARAGDFLEAAMGMIRKDAHVDGNFYICPVYNEMILKQAKIGIARIAKDAYFSIATPSGVQAFERHFEAARKES